MAYAASRLPATYAANARVLSILAGLDPGFKPASLCDLGAGPGTAALAASALWGENLDEMLLLEPNAPLRRLGQRLLQEARVKARYEAGTLESFTPSGSFDIVLASYVFNEIRPEAMVPALERMWPAAGKALVLVETGTPHGYRTLMRARDVLLGAGAFLAAPCPHSRACPLAGTDNWCHFSVRVQRTALHRAIKPGASLSYEDEKFCYLIATRREYVRPAARVVGAPKGGKVLSLPLCRADGAFRAHQTSRRDPAFPALKRLGWGDGVEEFSD